MACPASHISKLLLAIFISILIAYLLMDVCLYLRIQKYPLNNDADSANNATYYSDVTWLSCKINPLCDVTVKAVLLDHTNYYLFGPLVTIFDDLIDISHLFYITPNSISFFHVFVALLSAKCISSDSLSYRRIGVALFEVRTFLDDLDGHIARVRKNVKGERSEVGTAGYYIDGLCDAIGCTALLLGVYVFLRNNPPRRGYMQLPTTSEGKEVICKGKGAQVTRKVGFFSAQLALSSMAWNRYIALYQDLLESKGVGGDERIRRNEIFKSSLFFVVAWLWRIVNVHNMVHCMLLAIFCDKLWEFLKGVQYCGFVILAFVIGVTEVHVTEVKRYLSHKLFTSDISI